MSSQVKIFIGTDTEVICKSGCMWQKKIDKRIKIALAGMSVITC